MRLSTKFGAIGATLLLMTLASIALTLWVAWQLEGGAAAVNEAGRMRMQTWRLGQALSAGDQARFAAHVGELDRTIALLHGGDASRPLFVPRDEASQQALADAAAGWATLRGAWSQPDAPSPQVVAQQADAQVEHIDAFVTAIERQLSRWTALLNTFQFVMMGLAIFSAVALICAGYLLVFDPLSRLHAGLARIGEGDLSARVQMNNNDEFGALSDGFNHMAHTLQGLYQGLEQRVREKTERLERERERLAALYEAAAFVATATSLDELASGFARQVRRVAGAEASAVRWSDEANQRYLMLASDCLPQQVVEAEQCVPTGDCFCGQPQQVASTRVIPIRAADEFAMPGHCERAGYETVISVPVRLHERMVGEVDLFYRREVTLGAEDQTLLETLASHLAGAIEGLRADALAREAAIAEERGLLARELHDSIAQSLSFLKIQAGLLRESRRRGDDVGVERALDELDAGIRESLADVRELLIHFRTRTNHEDFAPALRTTLTKFEHQTGLATHLSIEGDGLPLAADVQAQVLHVVQEALSNVRKHAHARQVWVNVQQTPRWRVEVRDDGRGFSGAPVRDEAHVGMRIMRERADSIGATVDIASMPGKGTAVVLVLPQREVAAA